MYGPGIGISVIALPTGIAPFVVGSDGDDAAGVCRVVGASEGFGDVRPVMGLVAASETAESPEMSSGVWRAHAASAEAATAPVLTAKNPRRFIVVPSAVCTR